MQESSWRRTLSKLLMFQDRKVAPLKRLVAVKPFVKPRTDRPVNVEASGQAVSLTNRRLKIGNGCSGLANHVRDDMRCSTCCARAPGEK